jgi:restriction endonuclease S subunit
VSEQTIFSSSLVRLRLSQDISPEYIYWSLQSQQFWQQIQEAKGSAMYNVTVQAISRLQFPIPSWATQRALVTYLNEFRYQVQGENYRPEDLQAFLQRIDKLIAADAES